MLIREEGILCGKSRHESFGYLWVIRGRLKPCVVYRDLLMLQKLSSSPWAPLLTLLLSLSFFLLYIYSDSFASAMHFARWQLRQCNVCSCEGSQRAEGGSALCCYLPWLYQELHVRTCSLSLWGKDETVPQTFLQQGQIECIPLVEPSCWSKECAWGTTVYPDRVWRGALWKQSSSWCLIWVYSHKLVS